MLRSGRKYSTVVRSGDKTSPGEDRAHETPADDAVEHQGLSAPGSSPLSAPPRVNESLSSGGLRQVIANDIPAAVAEATANVESDTEIPAMAAEAVGTYQSTDHQIPVVDADETPDVDPVPALAAEATSSVEPNVATVADGHAIDKADDAHAVANPASGPPVLLSPWEPSRELRKKSRVAVGQDGTRHPVARSQPKSAESKRTISSPRFFNTGFFMPSEDSEYGACDEPEPDCVLEMILQQQQAEEIIKETTHETMQDDALALALDLATSTEQRMIAKRMERVKRMTLQDPQSCSDSSPSQAEDPDAGPRPDEDTPTEIDPRAQELPPMGHEGQPMGQRMERVNTWRNSIQSKHSPWAPTMEEVADEDDEIPDKRTSVNTFGAQLPASVTDHGLQDHSPEISLNATHVSLDEIPEKGKRRAKGERPREDAQIDADHHLAQDLQRRLNRASELGRLRAEMAIRATDVRKPSKKTKPSRKDLPETTLAPSNGNPERAFSQIPQGGYFWNALRHRERPQRLQSEAVPNVEISQSNRTSRKEETPVVIRIDSPIPRGRQTASTAIDSRGNAPSASSMPTIPETPPSSSSSSSGTTASDSSGQDTTSSSSSSFSSDSKKRRKRKSYKRKLKARRKTALTRNIKYPEPAEYDGKANLEVYETFVFELKNWLKLSQMPSKYKMVAMKRFLTGNAGKHYMAFAAVNLKEWTVDSYLIALFNHCFPPHFRSQMRVRFKNCSQGNRSVREFIRELRTLGNRLTDIQEIHLRLRFWKGAAQYLRIEWAKAGLNAETSTLSELELAAERFETSESLRRREENQSNNNNGQTRTHNGRGQTPNNHEQRRRRRWEQKERRTGSSERNGNTKPQHPKPREEGAHRNGSTSKGDAKGKRDWKSKKPEKRNSKLSKDEKDELRASNKCFTCRQTGHLSKDCPSKNTMRKPTVGTMTFAEIDNLNQNRRDLPLNSISIQLGDESRNMDLWEARNRVFIARIRYQLEIHAPYAGDRFVEQVTGDRFEITVVRRGAAFRIIDRMMASDAWDLDREFVEYEDFDAGESLHQMRSMLFETAALNNDAVTGNIIIQFEDELNSPDSGLVDPDRPLPNERYPERRWAVRPAEHYQVLEIQDRFPYLDDDPLPGPYVVTRRQLLVDNFDVVTYLHEARWNQRRAISQLNEGTPYPGDYLPSAPVFTYYDPRWIITELNMLTTIILDRSVNMEYPLARQDYLDHNFDMAKWMDRMKLDGLGINMDITNTSDDQGDTDSHIDRAGSSDEPRNSEGVDAETTMDDDESAYYSAPEEMLDEQEVDDLPELQSALVTDYSVRDDDDLPDLQSATESEPLVIDEPGPSDSQRYASESEGDISGALADLYLGSTTVPGGPNQKGRKGKSPKTLDRLERNCARTKDFERLVPSPVVVMVKVNGNSARALLDTGSLADFISTRLVDQLSLPINRLEKPLTVQLAVTGSRSMINGSTTVEFEYQSIREQRRFDVLNLENYDLILGTPFLFQHKLLVGFNPSKVAVGADESAPIVGEQVSAIPSRATDIYRNEIEKLRQSLKEEARDLCRNAADTSLPPMRAVNHTIPLVDKTKVYSWRPSRCPEAMKPLWVQKRDEYLKNGRWRFRTGNNAAPLLFLWKPKPGTNGQKSIRTVVDKREQNANTVKMASPLPDMESILRNAASHPYRSSMDGKDAYEQIRIDPEHVPRSLFSTPDGTMESLVLQQGDCNGGATYQSLMNHIFAPFIGVFMDVYLDDLIIYSDTAEDHVRHIQLVLDVLRKQKLYLSWDKMNFFAEELNLLGHVVSDKGIKMDPNKVDSIVNWKTPTNKDLLAGFLGAVGYLAPGVQGVRIPMAVLSRLTGSDKTFKWGPTEQRAFEQIKQLVQQHRETHRVGIEHGENSPSINLVCDASLTGGGGHVSQGEDLQTARTIAFWSGKFNPAQQNYPTHERELLAIVESLKWFKTLLLGTKFRIYTDHKALQHLMTQKNLSPRQARWLELLHEFDFEILYLPGEANTLADSLSRMYSDEPAGVVRAPSEYISPDIDTSTRVELSSADYPSAYAPTQPLYTGPALFADLDAGLGMVDNGEGRRKSARARRTPKKGDEIYDSLPTKPVTPRKGNAPINGGVRIATKADSATDKRPTSTTEPEAPEKIPRGPSAADLENLSSRTAKTQRLRWRATVEEVEDEGTDGGSDTGHNRDSIPEPVITPSTLEPSDTVDDSPPAAREPLAAIVSSAEGIDIYDTIRNSYVNDAFFRDIFQHPDRFRNFEVKDGLLYLREGTARMLCVPDVDKNKRKIREIIITHAHSILAHLAARKTIHYLREHVWWKTLASDVNAYCESCPTCASSKSRTTSQFGMLKTLEVPKRPWEAIGIDFVGPLPESRNRHGNFDMICVIIDHLTSLVHLVPTVQTYRAKDIAELIFDEVYKHHGLPKRIISDRDSLFTSVFWKHLHKLIGTELRFSSAYHPQTDGATERANRTITQMLRQCISPDQKDWVNKLPGIEFALNSARSDTTGFSPFYLNYGRVPDPMIWDSQSEYPGVRVFAQRMKDAIMTAHDAIIAARVKQTVQANKHRRPAPFDLNDLVYLSTENLALPKKRARKLVPKFIGPYRIISVKKPGSAYELELPADMARKGIHPVYHASKLRLHVPNDDRRFPGRQLRQFSLFSGDQDEAEWAVDRILNHFGKGTDALFHIRWKTGDTTWAQYRSIANLDALKTYYETLGIDGISRLPVGKGTPPSDEQIFTAGVSFAKGHLFKEGRTHSYGSLKNLHYTETFLPCSSQHQPDINSDLSSQMSSYLAFNPTTTWSTAELKCFHYYEYCLARHKVKTFYANAEGGTPPPALEEPKPRDFDKWRSEQKCTVIGYIEESTEKRGRDINEIGGRLIVTNLTNLLSGKASQPSNDREPFSDSRRDERYPYPNDRYPLRYPEDPYPARHWNRDPIIREVERRRYSPTRYDDRFPSARGFPSRDTSPPRFGPSHHPRDRDEVQPRFGPNHPVSNDTFGHFGSKAELSRVLNDDSHSRTRGRTQFRGKPRGRGGFNGGGHGRNANQDTNPSDKKNDNDKRPLDNDGDVRMGAANLYEAEKRLGGKDGPIQNAVRESKRLRRLQNSANKDVHKSLSFLKIDSKPEESGTTSPSSPATSDLTEQEVSDQAAILVASPTPFEHPDSPASASTETTIEHQVERMED